MTIEEIMDIPTEDLGKGSPIQTEFVPTVQDLFLDMALTMTEEIRKNNENKKKTAFICPVGPVGYLEIFARLVNAEGLSLKNTYIFTMDEYLDDDMKKIPPEHPLSFTGHMYSHLYDLLKPELTVPENNRFFPTPGEEGTILRVIERIGGVDTALGGIGINGHIAFNEPPSPNESITDDAFKNLSTRIVKLTPETRTINSTTNTRGAIDLIPKYGVTIGMKEILGAKKIRFYLNREWQSGVVRKILHGPVTRFTPASFFQEHADAKLTMCRFVAELPGGRLR